MDFLVSRQPAKSASEKPCKVREEFRGKITLFLDNSSSISEPLKLHDSEFV